MTRVEDLESRLVGQRAHHVTWIQDWACIYCRKHGGVTFQITGGGLDVFNKPTSKESQEDILKKVFYAHRGESSKETACSTPLGKLLLGLAWRWDFDNGPRRQLFLPRKDGWLPETYSWPPWVAT